MSVGPTSTRRASVEEVAGGLLEDVERDHPEQVDAINTGIDRFFDSLPSRRAEQPDWFVAELHEALPERYAKQAEAIYLRHAVRLGPPAGVTPRAG